MNHVYIFIIIQLKSVIMSVIFYINGKSFMIIFMAFHGRSINMTIEDSVS